MIIWINGAFGSGKTQTAYELHRRVDHAYVYDPENVGYFLRKNVPKELGKSDFQDYELWREHNYSMLKYLDREYEGLLIVPMTLVDPFYFDEIVGRLREDGATVHHFSLCASKAVIHNRLRKRGEGPHSWAARQTERCINALADERFAWHVNTDNQSIEDNVAFIAERSNISLRPDHRSGWSKKVDRVKTQLKHIRFF